MTDNRIFSPDACPTCGRLGDPHAEWCASMNATLREIRQQLARERYTGTITLGGPR